MRNRFFLLALILPAVAACSSDSASDSSSAPAAPPAATAQTTLPAAAATTTTVVVAAATTDVAATVASGSGAVGIADFKFDPPTVNVPVGGSVVWTNNDTQPHTATSAGNFDAGAIQPGATATVKFKTAGSFTYICSFHPFMTGTVVVG